MKDFSIPIPEGCVIDVENSDFDEGIIKFKKGSSHRIFNWEDFISKELLSCYIKMSQFYDKHGEGGTEFTDICVSDTLRDYYEFNEPIFANITDANSITALIKLMLVRSIYVGDWKPNWENGVEYKYVIENCEGCIEVVAQDTCRSILSFPTGEMAELFLEQNRDLLEKYFNF